MKKLLQVYLLFKMQLNTYSALPLNAAKSILIPLFGLDLKVEGTCCGGPSGKINAGDLFKAEVDRRFVYVDEASLQRIEEA